MPPRKQHPAKGWAGTFDRTSLVRTDIHQDSSENQQRLNRQAAPAYGLQIRPCYVFSEPGVPASKPIPRRVIERGINAVVREKAIEALIFASVDRCSRLGMRHVGEMLDAVDGVGGRVIFARQNLDSSRPANRAIIAFLAEQAKDEAETLAWRIETWHEGCRIKGKWVNIRPYGHQVIDGKLVPHPDEAPIVRQMRAWVLDGWSLWQVTKALNDQEIPSPGAAKVVESYGKKRQWKRRPDTPWTIPTVTRVLTNPSLVGWQRHKGRIVLGPDGEPVSFGEGILTPGEHARLLAEIERRTTIVRNARSGKREAGTKTGGGRRPTQLLVGFARCDGCTYGMATQPAYGTHAALYRCNTYAMAAHCSARASIRVMNADEEVMRQLRLRLGALEPGDPILDAIAENWREVMMPEDEGERAVFQSRLDAVRARIVDLEEARYVRGDFTTSDDVARWDRMMERLKVQRDAVLQDLEELGPPPDFDLASLRASYDAEAWDETPLPQRRRLLRVAVAKVVITRPERRGAPASDRVRVVLVGEEPEASGHESGASG
jgi:site-specific DNA recombinase